MGVADVSTSLFQATSAATAQAKPSFVKTIGQDAVGSVAQPTDKVDFSDLASALKGDALDLFTNLSADDRKTLGGLVSGGALSADELNDALSAAVKGARKKAFWEAAGEDAAAAGGNPSATQQGMRALESRMTSELESRRAAMYAPGVSASDRMAALSQLSQDLQGMQNSWDQLAGVGQAKHAYSLSGGDARFFASAAEDAAGKKLVDLGFHSTSVDKALGLLTKGFAQQYLTDQGKTTIASAYKPD